MDQVSILKDLTLDMWVPSFRCSEAHRIQRKIPRFQLAQEGFFAPQSAHCELPGRLSKSCRSFSLRACCLLLMEDILSDGTLWRKQSRELKSGVVHATWRFVGDSSWRDRQRRVGQVQALGHSMRVSPRSLELKTERMIIKSVAIGSNASGGLAVAAIAVL